jgi:hypothetical protein
MLARGFGDHRVIRIGAVAGALCRSAALTAAALAAVAGGDRGRARSDIARPVVAAAAGAAPARSAGGAPGGT